MHIHGNILDLVITNTEELIHNVTVHPQSYQPISSDHHIISFQFSTLANATPYCSPQLVFDADYNGLNNFLSNIDFSICEWLFDIESIWSFIKNSIIDGMNIYIPKIRTQPNQSPK